MSRERIDWSQVDLRRPTSDLCQELGCSRQRLHQKRKELGIPKEEVQVGGRINWDGVDFETQTNGEIHRITGHARCTIADERKRRGLPNVPTKHDPCDIDWDAVDLFADTGEVMAGRLGCCTATIYRRRRRQRNGR